MGAYDCDNYNDLMARIDEVKKRNKVTNSPTQMSGTSDAEFWKKRALEYSKTCCDLLARLSNGTKVDSIQLNENGISFHISTQPERKTGASDLISRRAVELALIEKGQASKRYKLGEFWELNGEEIREALASVPSAQPEWKKWTWTPAFNGKFTGGAYWFNCSKCGRIVPEVRNGGWNFCPNCGADMRGDEQDG